MAGFLHRVLLATLSLVFLTFSNAIAEDEQPATGVALKHEEVRLGVKEECGGGGILGAIDCVAIRIEGAGADGNVTSIASLGLVLSPVLRPDDNYSVVKVYVRVEGGPAILTEHFENQSQTEADAKSDTRLVKERLKRWTTNLTQDQISQLLNTGQTTVEISRPFQGLKILKLESPPAILTLIMPVQVAKTPEAVLSFLYRSAGGWQPPGPEGVPFGTPFLVKAEFDRAPENTPVVVELDWPGMTVSLSLNLNPEPGSARLFRSHTLVMTEDGQVVAYIEG